MRKLELLLRGVTIDEETEGLGECDDRDGGTMDEMDGEMECVFADRGDVLYDERASESLDSLLTRLL